MLTLTVKVLLCWAIFILVLTIVFIEPTTLLILSALAIVFGLTFVFISLCSKTPEDDPW